MPESPFADPFFDKTKFLQYLVAALSLFFISTRVLHIHAGHIFALLLCLVLWFHLERQPGELQTLYTTLDSKLAALGNPSHFYMDANVINFFYSIFRWRDKNAQNFDEAVASVNNVLRIHSDAEKPLLRPVDSYDVARDQATAALNLMHGFVYSIDQPLLIDKLKVMLTRLQQLLERHLVKIQERCAPNDINQHTRYIQPAGPKPNDPQAKDFDLFV
ncbi:hypothetical protein BJ741DRAFT_715272 [Chytriomyces cf. hyalinus JEL632]|nr:hypothetical protein BJ741DRAFT_715272 [Chytriomyces cf. hyalinus JEL632]